MSSIVRMIVGVAVALVVAVVPSQAMAGTSHSYKIPAGDVSAEKNATAADKAQGDIVKFEWWRSSDDAFINIRVTFKDLRKDLDLPELTATDAYGDDHMVYDVRFRPPTTWSACQKDALVCATAFNAKTNKRYYESTAGNTYSVDYAKNQILVHARDKHFGKGKSKFLNGGKGGLQTILALYSPEDSDGSRIVADSWVKYGY